MKYRLYDQWGFIYFELDISDYQFLLNNKQIEFRKANSSDIRKIKNDIYPVLNGYGEDDKKYLENPDKFTVFIAEKENRIIHYFLIYENALKSPLFNTPIYKNKISDEHAYLGSAFTSPYERGGWIMPYSISNIINYIKEKTNVKKVLLIVHKNTPGAAKFYERLGFKLIKNSSPKNPIQWLIRKIID